MCSKQDGAISLFNDKLLKLVDQFTFLGYNISSTESDVNIRIENAWTVSNRLMTISGNLISDKKKGILPSRSTNRMTESPEL